MPSLEKLHQKLAEREEELKIDEARVQNAKEMLLQIAGILREHRNNLKNPFFKQCAPGEFKRIKAKIPEIEELERRASRNLEEMEKRLVATRIAIIELKERIAQCSVE